MFKMTIALFPDERALRYAIRMIGKPASTVEDKAWKFD